MGELTELVEDYVYSDVYPFQGPGHKRSFYENDFLSEFYKRDIAGVQGFDKVSLEDGSLCDARNRLSRVYKADESYILTGGVSVGMMAAVFATLNRGDKVLVMRNSRRYVYNAIQLRELRAVYISGDVDEDYGYTKGLTIEVIEESIKKNDDVKAVILTSPTLDGISSEVEDIAEFLHERRIPLIVDASYGAHFGFAGFLPINAVECGADIVLHSLSESLPSPVQTGVLHINGSIIDNDKIRDFLGMFQDDEPSFPLLLGMDKCLDYISDDDNNAWQRFYDKRASLSDELKKLNHIEVFDAFTMGRSDTPEIGKMILSPKAKNMNGKQLYDRLKKEFGILPILSTPEYVLVGFSICDTDEGYEKLASALVKLDNELEAKEETTRTMSGGRDLGSLEALFGVSSNESSGTASAYPAAEKLTIVKPIHEAINSEKESVPINMCEGRVSGAFVGVYPSEQPILVPGQKITRDLLTLINHYRRNGYVIKGEFMERIEVLRESKNRPEA